MNVEGILKARYPADVVDALLGAYREIEANYIVKKWKASELDAGHFVEAARRIIEFVLLAKYTPVNHPLSHFTDAVLKQYEQSSGDESFRLLIPRALKAIYNIRNKRGVGHISGVSPNEMDATYILYTAKWVLAELVRLVSGAPIADTQRAVDAIVERRLAAIWKEGDVTRILDTRIKARDQILVLLYDASPQSEAQLQTSVEYQNRTKFRAILRTLHRARLIFLQDDGRCIISPLGVVEAEAILLRYATSR